MSSNVSASSLISSRGPDSAIRSCRPRCVLAAVATRRAVAVISCTGRSARSAINQPNPAATTPIPPSTMPPCVSSACSVSSRIADCCWSIAVDIWPSVTTRPSASFTCGSAPTPTPGVPVW
jgi:hypothetical protein